MTLFMTGVPFVLHNEAMQSEVRLMHINWQTSILAVLVSGLSACAQTTASVNPENVTAVYVNHVPYMGFSCTQLEQDQIRIAQDLEDAAQQKSDEKTGPVIARLKGEAEAVKRAILEKRCPQKAAEAKKTP